MNSVSGFPGRGDDTNFLTGYITGVRRVTKGHSLAAAAVVGATVLTLHDVADFIEGEGRSQAMVSGQVYDYDEVDPEANTITLATPLTVAAAEDDPVDLFDPEVGGTIVVGYEAGVMLDDSDPTGRPIQVDVGHALTQMLEESERGAFGENVTLMRTGEHSWALWQVDGKIAANLVADEAIAAADDAFDKALEGLTAAQLALAISDGMVDIYYQTSAPWANGSTIHDDDTGDIWVDTDASTDTAYRWLDRTWTLIGDASIVAALLQAQSAQTTADGKIRLFVQATAPTLAAFPDLGYGDLWHDTDDDNKEYYWDGDSWEPQLVGSNAIASLLIGKTVIAGASSTSGERIVLRLDGSGGILEFFTGSVDENAPGYMNPGATGSGVSAQGFIRTHSPDMGYGYAGITLLSGTSSASPNIVLAGELHAWNGIDMHGQFIQNVNYLTGAAVSVDDLYGLLHGNVIGDVTGDLNGDITGGPTISGTITAGSLTGVGGSSFVMAGNSGVLSRGVPVSLGAADSGGAGFRMIRTPN